MKLDKLFILTLLASCHLYNANAMEIDQKEYITKKVRNLAVITPHTGIKYRGSLSEDLPTDALFKDLETYYLKQNKQGVDYNLRSFLATETYAHLDSAVDLFEVNFSRWVNLKEEKGVIVVWGIDCEEDHFHKEIETYEQSGLKIKNSTQIINMLDASYSIALKAFANEFQKDNAMYYSTNIPSNTSKKTLDILKLKPIRGTTEQVVTEKRHFLLETVR